MAVHEVPQQFKTTDGRHFDDKETAERHQKLLDAKEAFAYAQSALGQVMAQTFKTADGKWFKWQAWDYYFPVFFHGGVPHICRVTFIGRNFEIDGEKLYLQPYPDIGIKNVEISDLYYSEKAAKVRLLEMLNEHKKEVVERIKKLKDELNGGL